MPSAVYGGRSREYFFDAASHDECCRYQQVSTSRRTKLLIPERCCVVNERECVGFSAYVKRCGAEPVPRRRYSISVASSHPCHSVAIKPRTPIQHRGTVRTPRWTEDRHSCVNVSVTADTSEGRASNKRKGIVGRVCAALISRKLQAELDPPDERRRRAVTWSCAGLAYARRKCHCNDLPSLWPILEVANGDELLHTARSTGVDSQEAWRGRDISVHRTWVCPP